MLDVRSELPFCSATRRKKRDDKPCLNAFVIRLYGLTLLFKKYLSLKKPPVFTDEQWEVLLTDDLFRIVEIKKRKIVCRVHKLYDFFIHFIVNNDRNTPRYSFNLKTLYRWWTEMDAEAFSPIANKNEPTHTVRTLTVPKRVTEHPRVKELYEGGADTHDELCQLLSGYFGLLLESLVEDRDELTLLYSGKMGSRRKHLGGELNADKIKQTTKTIIAQW